ncbi:MAG: hypothetical protein FJ299_13110 [Planctomycetes bacterium]|nr:hypothetical protein [Planctomycetota bacterium]
MRIRHCSAFLLGLLAWLAPAQAQWPTDPALNLALADLPGEQVLSKLATRADGGAYVGWFDSSAGAYQVRLQRLLPDGSEAWTHGGLLVSANPQSTSLVDWDLIADSTGHCVLVFTDIRDGGDLDVHAYRVAPDGTQVWGANGLQLSANSDYEPSPRVCETSDGNFAFTWARLPAVVDGGIMLQRVTPAGVPLLAPGGLTLVSVPGEDPAFCSIVPGEAGSVILAWIRSITTFSSPRHLRACKFGPNGAPLWPVLNVYDASSLPIAHWPQVQPDGQGGAVLAWHRALVSDFDVLVQRLSAGGVEQFAHNGISVATTAGRGQFDPTIAQLGGGELLIAFNERNSAQSQWGIRAQRITAAGALAFGPDGLELAPLDGVYEGPPRSAAWNGDAIVLWHAEPTGQFGVQRLLARRVSASGAFPWGPAPVEVSNAASTKYRMPTAIDCRGLVQVAWEDNRNGTPDVYAQALRADGQLGAPISQWTDLGLGTAGVLGVPQLSAQGFACPGTSVAFALDAAKPGALTTLVVGSLRIDLPLLGGTLVPLPQLLIGGIAVDAVGHASYGLVWPAGIPSGSTLYLQYWLADAAAAQGFASSNGLQLTMP